LYANTNSSQYRSSTTLESLSMTTEAEYRDFAPPPPPSNEALASELPIALRRDTRSCISKYLSVDDMYFLIFLLHILLLLLPYLLCEYLSSIMRLY